MNRTIHIRFASFAHTHSLRMLIILVTLFVGSVTAMAQSTAFSYQGRLNDGANAANGAAVLTVFLAYILKNTA